MRSRLLQRDVWPALFWLGLAWVYSSAFWLVCLLAAAQSGWPSGTLVLALRLGGALAVGVGLCATERWAWAPAVCISGFYAAIGCGVAVAAAGSVAMPPAGTLSWTPVFLGFNTFRTLQLAVLALGVGLVSAASAAVLWSGRSQYEVPHRRGFTLLVRRGLLPTLALLAADAYLLAGVWGHWVR